MLMEIKVKNFAIIDSVHILFQPGLNILSGETGAGKSVLLKSLSLLMGEKAQSDTVRTGATSATIEGRFDLTSRPDIRDRMIEQGLDESDDTFVVRRVIPINGKSRVYLNGNLCTLNSLRELVAPLIELTTQSAPLIEMTGQHDSRHLLSRSHHLDILDHYTGCWGLRLDFSEKLKKYRSLEKQITTFEEQVRERAQRLDFLVYQKDEIEALDLKVNEDKKIEEELYRLRNVARLRQFVDEAEEWLYSAESSSIDRIHRVLSAAKELKETGKSFEQCIDNLAQAKTLIEEAVYDLRAFGEELEANPERLEQLEKRLSQLRQLQKKYGPTYQNIMDALEQMRAEITDLQGSDEHLKILNAEKKRLDKELTKMADELHLRRVNAAKLLSKGVNDELLDLNMKGLIFHVMIEPLDERTMTGSSHVEFMTQSSKQDEPKSLNKTASGGELSRILLSLKQVVGGSSLPRTYLFDEVDSGVSGQTAVKVGRKLKTIAQNQQVICVTHLPQVAAFGDVHFYIHKSPDREGVHMEVLELKDKQQVREIARLISGEKITETSLAHAKQLLKEPKRT